MGSELHPKQINLENSFQTRGDRDLDDMTTMLSTLIEGTVRFYLASNSLPSSRCAPD